MKLCASSILAAVGYTYSHLSIRHVLHSPKGMRIRIENMDDEFIINYKIKVNIFTFVV